MYGCVVSRALNYGQFIKQVGQVEWNVSELQSQHSEYVDKLVKEVAGFDKQLNTIKEYAHVSPEIRSVIWTQLIICIFRALVEA